MDKIFDNFLDELKLLYNLQILNPQQSQLFKSAEPEFKNESLKKYFDNIKYGKPETQTEELFNIIRNFIELKERNSQIISQLKIGKYAIDRAIIDESGIIGIELKPLHKIQKNKTIVTNLDDILNEDRTQEQLKHYLFHPKMRFLILTNLCDVFIFTKWNINKDKITSHLRFNFIDFFKEYLKYNRFKDLLIKYFRDYPIWNLDKHFFKDLDEYWKSIDFLIADKTEKIKFINTLIMVRLLEDTGAIPYGKVEEEWNRAKEYHGKKLEKRLKAFLNDFIVDILYEYYDTELLKWNFNDFLERYKNILDKIIISTGNILGYEGFQSVFFKGLKFYDFNTINEDIFGKAYENFLAQLRKETGIFYTPAFITEYISYKIIENRFKSIYEDIKDILNSEPSNESIEKIDNIIKLLDEITILDPACGSGSFLVKILKNIYFFYKNIILIIDAKINYYQMLNSESDKGLFGSSEFLDKIGILKKIKEEKFKYNNIYNFMKNIVTKHIYGVDLDSTALEIAKLNIWKELIKLEPEEFVIEKVRDYGHHHVFPDLTSNFKNFDSVLSSIEDWKNAFPSVFEQGGFSVIIGNPPYVRGKNLEESSRNNLREMYPDLFLGHIDIYSAFIRRAVDLLKNNGLFGFIISNKWMRAKYGKPLRKLFLEEGNILELINFSDYRVFEDATVDTVIILFEKGKDENKTKILSCVVNEDFNNFINNGKNLFDYISDKGIEIDNTFLSEDAFLLLTREEYDLKKKIESIGKPLRDWDVKIYRGILTGLNEAFIIDEKTKRNILNNCKTEEEKERTEELIKPILRGRDIGKYCYNWANLWLISTFPSKKYNIDNFPAVEEYLLLFGKNKLEQSGKKGSRKKTNNKWFETQDNIAYYSEFEKEKIVWQRVSQEQKFTLVPKGLYCEATTHTITGSNLKYLLGIFNSTLFKFCFYKFYMGGGIEGEIKGEFIGKFPIIPITKENIHITSQIESLITQILNEKQENNNKDTSELESQIDKLIYKLYQLTPEEKEIVNK